MNVILRMNGRNLWWMLGVVIWGMVELLLLLPGNSQAVPAYARRYNVECTTCHSPLPPRLNNVGMVYRRSGLRLPDAGANGELTLKNVPATGIGDAISLSLEFLGQHLQKADAGTGNPTSLQFGEVALVGGTAIGDHYSVQTIMLPRNDEGQFEFEMGEVQANFGQPQSQFYVRGGLTETMVWQKANEGSITLSEPLAFAEDPSGPVGNFAGFPLGLKQTEVEAGYMMTKLQNGHMLSTILTASALNGVSADDPTATSAATTNPAAGTDYMLQATQLIGDRNTIGAFYYNGRTLVDAAGALSPPGPFTNHFYRAGAVGSVALMDRFELVGGIVSGQDKSQELDNVKIKSLGGYLEGNVQIRPNWIAAYRFDQTDPNTDAGGDLAVAHTLSTTAQLESSLFLTAEYSELRLVDTRPHQIVVRARFVY